MLIQSKSFFKIAFSEESDRIGRNIYFNSESVLIKHAAFFFLNRVYYLFNPGPIDDDGVSNLTNGHFKLYQCNL